MDGRVRDSYHGTRRNAELKIVISRRRFPTSLHLTPTMIVSDPATDNEKHISGRVYERPTGLKGVYYHPFTQICLLGFVCFMCPGLFNALNGLGAGGQVDTTTSANANAALYATLAVSAFFAGYHTFFHFLHVFCLTK